MKKIIFLLCSIFFSNESFAQDSPTCPAGGSSFIVSECGAASNAMEQCTSSGGSPIQTNRYKCSANPDKFTTTYNCKTSCTCPTGQKLNTVMNAGVATTSCIPDVPSEPGDDEDCPDGQIKDGRGKCNTKCEAPNVYNVMADACQPVTNCTYPQLYNVLANACADNPENCAEGASRNVITGQCTATDDTSCPAGFSCVGASCLTCAPSGNSNSSSGGGGSSAGAASSGGNTSSGSNSSVTPPPKPPVTDSDNADQNQGSGGSHYIPQGTSMATCRTQNSQTVCNDYQNCQLTFGVGKCVGMTEGQSCPNSYIMNGQKYCVLSGGNNSNSSSGSNTSSGGGGSGSNTSQAGECDPTAKSYDECMGRNKLPSATDTSKIKTDFDIASNKAIEDYTKSMKEDSEVFTRDGISFKSAPDALKQAVLSHIPRASACQDISITYFNTTKSLDCRLFEKFKTIFAWFISIVTIIYIFQLAIRPVER